ncbi:LOG family protein [Chlamydia vaughanii]|uniref:LOG family protein n=1 Tax=Chlamydia vaughanii TaxID=3112552 RepID=UPI0032B1FB72
MYNLFHRNHDATSPDGYLTSPLRMLSQNTYEGEIEITNIPEYFLGFHLPKHCLHLNLKSSLAQLGVDAKITESEISKARCRARLLLQISSHDPIASVMLTLLEPGDYIAKLFASDDRRLVRSIQYLERMLKHTDKEGAPLLCFGKKLEHLISLDVIDDRLVITLPTLPGVIQYDHKIYGLLPLIGKALGQPNLRVRNFLSLYQHKVEREKLPLSNHILLIKTEPLHIRTVFARVVNDLLPEGVTHTAANILEPTTQESGDIYEFHGTSSVPVERIPLEFFTIEPYKEHSFFCYRDLLKSSLESDKCIFDIFQTAPGEKEKVSTFISKGSEILHLSSDSWLVGSAESLYNKEHSYPENIQEYIEEQPCFPFLQAMETGHITSQGVLFSRYFPSSCLKGMLLSYHVNYYLQQIYFQIPSYNYGGYFSEHDRSLLMDLYFAGIAIFWVDQTSNRVLQYVKRRGKDSGMFVPAKRIQEFRSAYFIGIHGSCIVSEGYKQDLRDLLKGLHELTQTMTLPGFPPGTPLAIMTGGGPGAMAIGNEVAEELNLLSCGNNIDFEGSPVSHQKANCYLQAKMTYRLSSLIQRQEHFHVDLALFVTGGMGTDFEFSLELISIKTGKKPPVPIFLIGSADYWREKVTPAYQSNCKSGTNRGSEWVSNCVFCISSPQAGIEIFRQYMDNSLPIGPDYPPYPEGFMVV